MIIRDYIVSDKVSCLSIFDSNCPHYFDVSERAMFSKWLDHQADDGSSYSSPTYANSEKDAYYVVEVPERGVVACGGFYVTKGVAEARLAWGMIDERYHKKGLGTALYLHREKIIREFWPGHKVCLGTSQHTYRFYEKMGLQVVSITPSGYGPNLDQYEMVK